MARLVRLIAIAGLGAGMMGQALTPASATGTMDAKAIREAVQGKRIYLATPLGGELPMNYRPNGVVDANGNAISHNGWTIAYVDSEEHTGEDGAAENAIDGQTANYWHTEWKNAQPNHPHFLILNLGQPQTISGFRYVPRQGMETGRIKDYRVFIGDNLVEPK